MSPAKKASRPKLACWTDVETKAQFIAIAKANGHTEGAMLRLLVNTFLKKNDAPQEMPAASTTKNAYLSVRLPAAEKVVLKNVARKNGFSPSAYAHSLLRANLAGTPHFNDDHLQALREANRQLAAIGKNINQIAKALNITAENAHLLKTLDLGEVRAAVGQHRQAVASLVRENLKSWGVEVHEHVDHTEEE